MWATYVMRPDEKSPESAIGKFYENTGHKTSNPLFACIKIPSTFERWSEIFPIK